MEWVQDMECVQELGMGTGSWNGYRKLEWIQEMEGLQEVGPGNEIWNGYRKLERLLENGIGTGI